MEMKGKASSDGITEGREGEGFALRTEEGEAEKNSDRRDMKNLRGGRGISNNGRTKDKRGRYVLFFKKGGKRPVLTHSGSRAREHGEVFSFSFIDKKISESGESGVWIRIIGLADCPGYRTF